MNNYEIIGRLIVSGLTTLILVSVWLGMLGDIWKVGPFK